MSFTPPRLLQNGHLNTILGNNGPRKLLVWSKTRHWHRSARDVLLYCRDGVRLHGEYTEGNDPARGLVILVHGWEGSSTSTHVLSTAHHLLQQGYSIFRLHLRDHGPSIHLNPEPFLAVRIAEILDAIEQVQQRFPHQRYHLVGFSLGGNIAVRAAANIDKVDARLDQVVAVCPPIDPHAAALRIRGDKLFHRYFVSAWRDSFIQKAAHFPALQQHVGIFETTDIIDLHNDYVVRFSEYPDAASYFNAYKLNARSVPHMAAPCHIILSHDDPVIPAESLDILPQLGQLSAEVTPWGGHCAFVEDYRLSSWIERRIVSLLG